MWGGKRDDAGGMTQMECRKRIAGMKIDNIDDDDDNNDHDQIPDQLFKFSQLPYIHNISLRLHCLV